MALLTLVRHGQASFLQSNYDKLSDLGRQQSRILGEYWLRAGVRYDQVYYGPACRHCETGDAVAGAFTQAGVHWPEPKIVAELDEYPGIEVVRRFLPGLMETHEDIRAMEREFREAGEKSQAFKLYDRLFERIARMYVDGELDSADVESWKSFCERVQRGIEQVRDNAPKNGRVVVFTSGGVIGAAVRLALDLAPQRTLELSWTARNAGYTEFLFSPGRFSLSSFNNHPHLESEDLLTYR